MAGAGEDQALEAIADATLSEENWDWDTPLLHQMAEHPDVHPWKIELSGLDDNGGIKIVASFNGDVRRAEFTGDRVHRVTKYWEGSEETADGTPIRPGITTPLAIKILAKELRSVAQHQSLESGQVAGLRTEVTSGLDLLSDSVNALATTINALGTKIGVQGEGILDNGAEIRALRAELQTEREKNASFRKQWYAERRQKMLRQALKAKKSRVISAKLRFKKGQANKP